VTSAGEARANLLDEPNPGLIARSHNIVREIQALHPDTDANSDRVLDSLCQFDALTGVVFLTHREASGSPSYGPSFARYCQHRTEPIFSELVQNQEMRRTIAGDDDAKTAAAIDQIDAMARSAGFRYDGWEGFASNSTTRRFIELHSIEAATDAQP
jgi:hypothetical protein